MDREAMIAALIFGGSGSGGGGGADAPLVVTFSQSGSNWSCDTSGDDIKAAVAAGKSVYGIYNNITVFQLTLCAKNSNAIEFSTVVYTDVPSKKEIWTLAGGKVLSQWIWKLSRTTLTPAITNGNSGKILSVTNDADGTVGWVVDKGAPYEVEFTITGLPSGTSYPVSVAVSLADIYAAVQRGDRVFGSVGLSADDVALGAMSSFAWNGNGDGYVGVSFDIIGISNGMIVLGHAQISDDGNGEVASLDLIPLSTAQMTYDSGTQTLAIVDPLA